MKNLENELHELSEEFTSNTDEQKKMVKIAVELINAKGASVMGGRSYSTKLYKGIHKKYSGEDIANAQELVNFHSENY